MVFKFKRLTRPPLVVVYTRHNSSCPAKHHGDFHRGCDCPKWLRFSLDSKQKREPAGTRSWTQAEERRAERQRQLDTGESPTAQAAPATAGTITQAVQNFLSAKEDENVGESTMRKLRYQLGLFEQFLSARSKFFPAEITPQDVLDFRSTWKTWSDLTRIKAQQNLRGFIRSACRENRTDVLDALKTIRPSREGIERRKPKPFSEDELASILSVVKDDAKMTALVHCMASTGLAIADAVQLERKNIADGWLRIERVKTGRSVRQKLDAGLHAELMAVLNGNPRYVFWHGAALPESECKRLQGHMREIMQSAGCYIKGNVFHRYRDSAVDTWLGLGWSMTDVSAALGDTLAICERHYADLASKRFEDRLAKLPVRTW
jgi:integrase